MTEKELASLCVNPNPKGYLDKQYNDSCWVLYSIDGKKLIKGSLELKEYKIADGTVAVCNNAFNLSGMQNNFKKYSVLIRLWLLVSMLFVMQK